MVKKIGIVLGWFVVGYVVFFALWLVLMMGCVEYERTHGLGYCGGDLMTEAVKVLYRPVVGLFVDKL
jgi:hypothetical protein